MIDSMSVKEKLQTANRGMQSGLMFKQGKYGYDDRFNHGHIHADGEPSTWVKVACCVTIIVSFYSLLLLGGLI